MHVILFYVYSYVTLITHEAGLKMKQHLVLHMSITLVYSKFQDANRRLESEFRYNGKFQVASMLSLFNLDLKLGNTPVSIYYFLARVWE